MPQAKGLLFLSHSSEDKELSSQFGHLVRQISLGQIDVWFSSDGRPTGGFRPGDSWFQKIREKMQSSSQIITLITPNSIFSEWVVFESGFGAASADNEKLAVITHGITSIADIPEPLKHRHAYRIDNTEGLFEFCTKLFVLYDVQFNEILFSTYSDTFFKAVATIVAAKRTTEIETLATGNIKTETIDRSVIEHFDRRFFELTSQLSVKSRYITYTIRVRSGFDQSVHRIEIFDDTTVQDVLNEIYEGIHEHVGVWKYLEEWILIDTHSGRRVVIREIASKVMASAVFKPGSDWTVKKLNRPYKPSDSRPEEIL